MYDDNWIVEKRVTGRNRNAYDDEAVNDIYHDNSF
jgi:hypothetical protein